MKSMKSIRLSKSSAQTFVIPKHEPIDDNVCPICQVDIGKKSPDGIKEGWALTPCGHAFGHACIKRYLATTEKPLCPICRQDVFHKCAHPILPVPYDPKKGAKDGSSSTKNSHAKEKEVAAGAAAPPTPSDDDDAEPTDPRQTMCPYCTEKKGQRRRKRARTAHGSSIEINREEMDAWQLAMGVTRAALHSALHVAHIRRHRRPHGSVDQESDPETSGLDTENEEVRSRPSTAAGSSPGLPPVPGPYGHWELASKEPDWKFLAWFDRQEPRSKTTAAHMR